MTDCKKFNNVTDLAGAKCDHPPHRNLSATGANAFAKMPADYDEQAKLTQQLVTAAQNGDKAALERLCIFYEPLFRKEMRREIFYKALGFEEGLSLARLKFIEIVMSYNGADFSHFAGYVRCRIHFALYDEMILSLRRLRAVQDSLCIVRRNEKGLGAGKQRGCFGGFR